MLGEEFKTLYLSFNLAPVGTESDRATSFLLSWLGRKKKERWEEAVNSIDFSHSSRKAWRTIKKLTGTSGRSSRQSKRLATCEERWTPGIARPRGSSTSSCPTNGKFQHLKVTVSLNPLGRRILLLPPDA